MCITTKSLAKNMYITDAVGGSLGYLWLFFISIAYWSLCEIVQKESPKIPLENPEKFNVDLCGHCVVASHYRNCVTNESYICLVKDRTLSLLILDSGFTLRGPYWLPLSVASLSLNILETTLVFSEILHGIWSH